MGDDKFGSFLRRKRMERNIGLREMAKKIGVSPTYLSNVERDGITPPTEEKVRALATILECNPDELLAMAGRVSADLNQIIRQRPIVMSTLLRAVKDINCYEDVVHKLTQNTKKAIE